MELLNADQMRQVEHIAINEMNIPGIKLMENAGRAVAVEIKRMMENIPRRTLIRVGIICGKGQNAGDGLVAARWLTGRRFRAVVFLTSDNLTPDSQSMLKKIPRTVRVIRADTPVRWKKNIPYLMLCDVLVDALFGIGLSRPLKQPWSNIVDDVNKLNKLVVSVDLPSGIDASTGHIMGTALRAVKTVTFFRPKIGHILYPGSEYSGELTVADIGIPDRVFHATSPDTFLNSRDTVSRLLPRRPDNSHKQHYGCSLILAGSQGMIGAGVLAAAGALRIGSGLTILAVPDKIYTVAARKLSPEAMCEPIPDGGSGGFGTASLKRTLELVNRATCILVGPGIGRRPETIRWIFRILKHLDKGKKWIFDADALFAFSYIIKRNNKFTDKIHRFQSNVGRHESLIPDICITPHSGEMARLVQKSRNEVEQDFLSIARNYSNSNRLTTVLKGSRTVIARPDCPVFINKTGNSALAKGSTGDVLAGMICGLAAQGLSTFDAGRLASYLLGRSADIAIHNGRTKLTFLATDIFQYLDDAILEISPERYPPKVLHPDSLFRRQ